MRRLAGLWLLVIAFPAALAAEPERVLRVTQYDTGGLRHSVEPMLAEALHAAGVTPVLVDIPLGRSLAEVDRGEIVDAEPARTREAIAAFHNVVTVEEPVYELRIGAFIRAGSDPVRGWGDLRPRRVVVYNGSVLIENLLVQHGITDVVRAETYTRAALMLAVGRGDVALLPHPETIAVLDRYHIPFIKPSGPVLAEASLYFVLNRHHADLAPRIAAALREYKARHRAAVTEPRSRPPLSPQ